MKNYIKFQQDHITKILKEKICNENFQMIKLKYENEAVIKQNKELKILILKIFYNVKTHELLETNREKEVMVKLYFK